MTFVKLIKDSYGLYRLQDYSSDIGLASLVSILTDDIVKSDKNFKDWALSPNTHFGGNCTSLKKDSQNIIITAIDELNYPSLIISIKNFVDIITAWENLVMQGKKIIILKKENDHVTIEGS